MKKSVNTVLATFASVALVLAANEATAETTLKAATGQTTSQQDKTPAPDAAQNVLPLVAVLPKKTEVPGLKETKPLPSTAKKTSFAFKQKAFPGNKSKSKPQQFSKKVMARCRT